MNQDKISSLREALATAVSGQPEAAKFAETLMARANPAFSGNSAFYASFLIEGPPGTGMVYTTRKAAEHLGLPTITYTMTPDSELMTSSNGCMNPHTVAATIAAKNEGVLILSDVDRASSNDSETLTQILDGKKVSVLGAEKQLDLSSWIIVMTTNQPENVDPKLLSKVDSLLHFKYPSP